MPRKKTGGFMNHGQLMAALVAQFPKAEYAFLTEVRNGTGFSSRVRTADAIALSLWPSRGLGLHGFELKQYRGDWIRELNEPAKAEAIAQYCDFWWLVLARADIVDLSEVPETWGVKAPDEKGETLVTLKTATRMPAKELSRSFIASLLRNASDAMTPTVVVEQRCEEARRKGYEEGVKAHADNRELERLQGIADRVRAFEDAAGVTIASHQHWRYTPAQAGAVVRALLDGDAALHGRLALLDNLERNAKDLLASIRKHAAAVKDAAAGLSNTAPLESTDAVA